MHFGHFCCAKRRQMWRSRTLLFRHLRGTDLKGARAGFNVLPMTHPLHAVPLLILTFSFGIAQQTGIPTFNVERPAIIAFFPPMTDAELEKNPDMNEVLGDFQLYASRAAPRLKRAGIDFEIASAVTFKVKIGKSVRTFKTGKVGVGYYFIAPGKQPRIEYGVHDDLDLLDIARKYFQTQIPSQ